MRYHKKWGKPCGVLTVFCELVFTARTFQNIHSKFFWVNSPPQPKPSRSLQLNEKQKQTQNQNLPEAYTWMRYNKKEGKPCGVLPFFFWLHFHSQDLPEPYTSIRPKRTPEHITPEWMRYKRGNPCGVLTFFCELVSTARMFQNTHLNETELKKNMKSMWRFQFFWLYLHSQNLPEAYSCMRGKKQAHS